MMYPPSWVSRLSFIPHFILDLHHFFILDMLLGKHDPYSVVNFDLFFGNDYLVIFNI